MENPALARKSLHILPATAVALTLCAALRAQDALRSWGTVRWDTDAYTLPALHLAAGYDVGAVLRNDGRIFVHGRTQLPDGPAAPPGTTFTRIAVGNAVGFALLSDGTIVDWAAGGATVPAPPLPPNTTYTSISCGWAHGVALRSDGVATAWGNNTYGQTTLTALPAGTTVLQAVASSNATLRRLSNGTIVVAGSISPPTFPALPPGTTYTDLWADQGRAIARRSDGVFFSLGGNLYGQGNVPPLPVGTSYTQMSLGYIHSIALRSDGVAVAWGWNGAGECDVPPLPAGLTIAQVLAGYYYSALRLSDGSVLGFGNLWSAGFAPTLPGGTRWAGIDLNAGLNSDGHVVPLFGSAAPALPTGMTYVDVSYVSSHGVALRSDGRAIAWGNNTVGQCAIPPLPPGLSYRDISTTAGKTLLVRSDGVVVGCGGPSNPPFVPPANTRYVAVDADPYGTSLLRSDGMAQVFGGQSSTQAQVPALPSGLRYVEVAQMRYFSAALRSDGQVIAWGSSNITVPALPTGVVYVEIDGNDDVLALRRSDGRIVCVAGSSYEPLLSTPAPRSGESFVEVTPGVARIGPTCTYTTIANGCAGTRAASRLVPRDTPRIGRRSTVTLFDLPDDLAVMVFGWNRIPALPLDPLGMTGCSLHISFHATLGVVGSGGIATSELPIPDEITLVGLRFHQQAIVLDAAANAAGLVMSDATEAIIGFR